METIRFDLPQSEIPTSWYNIQADLPEPLPPVIHPGRMEPIGPDDLAPLFAMELIKQEVSEEREIPTRIRCARSTACGVRPRCSGRGAWSRSSIPPPSSTTSTRGSLPSARTSPTPRSRRPSTTARKG